METLLCASYASDFRSLADFGSPLSLLHTQQALFSQPPVRNPQSEIRNALSFHAHQVILLLALAQHQGAPFQGIGQGDAALDVIHADVVQI